jgi:hypothetical protein
MCYFGSRDQFCIREEFEGLSGRDLMEECCKAVKIKLKLAKKVNLKVEERQKL